MRCSKTFLKACDELVLMLDCGISAGMSKELIWAHKMNKNIYGAMTQPNGKLYLTRIHVSQLRLSEEGFISFLNNPWLEKDCIIINATFAEDYIIDYVSIKDITEYLLQAIAKTNKEG